MFLFTWSNYEMHLDSVMGRYTLVNFTSNEWFFTPVDRRISSYVFRNDGGYLAAVEHVHNMYWL